MTVYLVGAGPGDPGLLTRRGAELLARADVVVYDRLVDPSLLSLAPPGALLVDAGKRSAPAPGGPAATAGVPSMGMAGPHASEEPAIGGSHSGRSGGPDSRAAARQDEINALLVAHGRAGRTVVRLKGGDPFLFGRGGEEAEALAGAGVGWEVVPGVTSATAVPAAAGVPVTHRGLSSSVTVVTGHVGDPTAPGGVDWESLARAGGTLVVLMGMATRAEIARRLQAAGRPADTPVAVVQWGTTPAQRAVRTTLAGLAAVDLGSPSVVVIGPVAGLDLDRAIGRPLAGTTVVVTRARDRAGPMAAAFRDAGARVLEVPVVCTADPDDGGEGLRAAAASLRRYQWVAFTSAEAVRRFVPLLRDGRDLAGVRLAAVGRATATALADHHLAADLLPDAPAPAGGGNVPAETSGGRGGGLPAGPAGSAAAALAAAFPDPPPGGRVLFPRAAGARPDLPDGLRARGWEVDEVVAYRTVPAPAPPAPVVGELAGARVVTFAAPSAVAAYLAMRDGVGRPLPVPPVVACIGPVTAAAARRAGLAVAVVAEAPSGQALAAALAAYQAAFGYG